MANTLTDLAADIYKAADVVSREQVGAITAVTINGGGTDRAAKGDTVRSHFTRSQTLTNITPSMTIPNGTDQTVDNKTITMGNFKGIEIPWTGEDIRSVNNGSGFTTIYGDQIAQAMRAITNQVETDILSSLYVGASRAYGSAGTTPFATAGNYLDASETLRILKDNGAPKTDCNLVMNTAAGAKFLGLQARVDMAGTDSVQRQGVLLSLAGVTLRESAQIQDHTKGSGASYLLNDASSSIGDTLITVDTGTGTVLAGDVITFAGDTNKYLVTTALTSNVIVIAEPGLRTALADNVAITVGANYAANVLFERSAFELAIRAPAVPNGGDAATDRMMVTDPRSGLTFDVATYSGYYKSMISVSAVWGVKLWKPEHTAVLLG